MSPAPPTDSGMWVCRLPAHTHWADGLYFTRTRTPTLAEPEDGPLVLRLGQVGRGTKETSDPGFVYTCGSSLQSGWRTEDAVDQDEDAEQALKRLSILVHCVDTPPLQSAGAAARALIRCSSVSTLRASRLFSRGSDHTHPGRCAPSKNAMRALNWDTESGTGLGVCRRRYGRPATTPPPRARRRGSPGLSRPGADQRTLSQRLPFCCTSLATLVRVSIVQKRVCPHL